MIIYTTAEQIDASGEAWRLIDMKPLEKVFGPDDALLTLGAALRGADARIEHFKHKAAVTQAMRGTIWPCDHSQVEFVFWRSCLGRGEINLLLL